MSRTLPLKISTMTAVCISEAASDKVIAIVADRAHSNLAHVIMDGHSSDGSLAPIEGAPHHRLRLISEPDTCIQHASGDGVSANHSDDLSAREEMLARVATALEDPVVEAMFSDPDSMYQADTSRIFRRCSTVAFNPRRLKRGWRPAHPTLCLRRAVHDRIARSDIGVAADHDFILRYVSQAPETLVHIPQALFKVHVGGAGCRTFSRIRQRMAGNHFAIRRNRVVGISTRALKTRSLAGQVIGPAKRAR